MQPCDVVRAVTVAAQWRSTWVDGDDATDGVEDRVGRLERLLH
ncbi:MAG: hypothetical protein RI958_281, partial [Actinomycetota bacterium]